jgi:hypothetical protein
MMTMHDLDCPCSKCEEVRQGYEDWLDELDAERFAAWQAQQQAASKPAMPVERAA